MSLLSLYRIAPLSLFLIGFSALGDCPRLAGHYVWIDDREVIEINIGQEGCSKATYQEIRRTADGRKEKSSSGIDSYLPNGNMVYLTENDYWGATKAYYTKTSFVIERYRKDPTLKSGQTPVLDVTVTFSLNAKGDLTVQHNQQFETRPTVKHFLDSFVKNWKE